MSCTPSRWLSPASAGPRRRASGTSGFGRRRSLGAGLAIAAALLLIAARPCAAAPIFATYSGADAGSLDGVGFTLSGLSNPDFGSPIQALDMSGADWNSVGSQQGRIYNANSVSSFAVTFAEPVSNLQMYLYYFRGGRSGGDGYSSYDFGEAFMITGGLGSPITQSGTALDTATTFFAEGVITFTGPVSSLSVTTTGGPATGGDQGFTFAVVPEPGAAGLVATACAAMVTGSAARRRFLATR